MNVRHDEYEANVQAGDPGLGSSESRNSPVSLSVSVTSAGAKGNVAAEGFHPKIRSSKEKPFFPAVFQRL